MLEDKIILNELISIDSQCSKSNREIHEYLKSKLSRFELTEYSFMKGKLELFNLIAKISGKSSKKPLVFLGHTDTVNASKEWEKLAFNPIEKDGRIYGLGSSDMKSGLASMIAAALSLNEQPENDIYLMFDADEEGSGTGGIKLMQDVNLKDARIVVAESTAGRIMLGHRGCLDMEIKVKGNELHSSRADSEYNEKNNAIYTMSTIIESLRKYGKEIEIREDESLGKPNLNIGSISGGSGANKVAGDCAIKLCRRVIPAEGLEGVKSEIENIVREISPSAEFNVIFSGEPLKARKESEIVSKLDGLVRKYYGSVVYGNQTGWTEAALFTKFGDVVIFGPGTSEVTHKPGEYVEISNLKKFTQIYRELMTG